jgi:triacylglycerol lipase
MESQVQSPSKAQVFDLKDSTRYARLIAIARAVFYQAGNTKADPGKEPNPKLQTYGQLFDSSKGQQIDPSLDPDFMTDYQLMYNIVMNDTVKGSGKPVYYGFVAKYKQSPYNYVIAIRGTEADTEWASDMDDLPVEFAEYQTGGKAKVVKGFYDLYESATLVAPPDVQNKTLPLLRLKDVAAMPTLAMPDVAKVSTVVAGHSLGAALATLYAAGTAKTSAGGCGDLIVYTYASPNVGNGLFAIIYALTVFKNYRIYNAPDLVPHLPVNIVDKSDPYIQVAGGFEINSLNYPAVKHMTNPLDFGDLLPAIGCAHVLPTYLYVLENLAGGDVNPDILNSENCACRQSKS